MEHDYIPPINFVTYPPSDPKEPAGDDCSSLNVWLLAEADHSLQGFGVLDPSNLKSPQTVGQFLSGVGIKKLLTS